MFIGFHELDGLDDIHAFDNSAEDGVFAVEPGCGCRGDEKLRAVGVGSTVGHAHRERAVVLQTFMELVLEIFAPDRLSATPSSFRIARLDHESLDHTMEQNPIVISTPSFDSILFPCMLDEVFDGFGTFFGEEADVDFAVGGEEDGLKLDGDLTCVDSDLSELWAIWRSSFDGGSLMMSRPVSFLVWCSSGSRRVNRYKRFFR